MHSTVNSNRESFTSGMTSNPHSEPEIIAESQNFAMYSLRLKWLHQLTVPSCCRARPARAKKLSLK